MSHSLIFYYPSIEGGGLEKNLFSLVNSLAKKKYHVNFITYKNNTKDKKFGNKFFLNKKIKIITADFVPGLTHRYIKYLFCFFRLLFLKKKKDDIIISFQGNVFPIIAAKLSKKKIVIRLNTAPSKYINHFLKKIFFKFFYAKSNLILVTCEDFKKEIKKFFNLKSIVHRQTLDFEDIKKKSKIRANFDFFRKFKGLKLINIGRLTHQKDQTTLLKAFSKLIRYRDARLLLLGSGDDKSKLINFIKKNELEKNVRIIPYASNPFKYLSLSDIKVLSSRYEGSPNILLETGCLGKLIISSNCKVGPRETLQSGKGGILFKVGNHNELFLILKKINLNSRKVKKKIEITLNYVKKNFKKDISDPFIKIINKI